ncbi:ras-related protein Rab-3-like isoform X2 [Tubulanus polymorphus]|uniref:ras-related protein Rab-3-like isoform X2 n=1 Tax=Tubulanus polymorphus TaxID=672921 RepID=UPI003DA26AA0
MSIRRGSLKDYDCSYKVLVIGDLNVGKTCFLYRYCDGVFKNLYTSTVGFDYKTVFKTVDNVKIKLQIWDTAGQERYRTLTSAYYRGAMGIVLMYDITRVETFNSIPSWYENIRSMSSGEVSVILVGTKSDCDWKREVDIGRARKLAETFDMEFFEVSAKLNINLDAVFDELVRNMLKHRNQRRVQIMMIQIS